MHQPDSIVSRRACALDTTRRRGPPSPLVLGAACQRKVHRSFEKYPEPNLPGVDRFVTRDSSCDRLIRGNMAFQKRKASLDLEWLGQRIRHRASSSVDKNSQTSHVTDASTDESHTKVKQVGPPRIFDGIHGNSYIEVHPSNRSSSEDYSHSRQSSVDSMEDMSGSDSIALPPLCLIQRHGRSREVEQLVSHFVPH